MRIDCFCSSTLAHGVLSLFGVLRTVMIRVELSLLSLRLRLSDSPSLKHLGELRRSELWGLFSSHVSLALSLSSSCGHEDYDLTIMLIVRAPCPYCDATISVRSDFEVANQILLPLKQSLK